MKFRSLMACLLLIAASIKGYGQDTTGLSLPELWEQAFANYPGLDVYRSQQRQAEFDKKLARNQYLPEVLLQTQNTFGTQNAASGAFFSLPGIYNVTGSGLDNSSDHAANLFGSVVMDWKFFQFGKQQKSQEAAQILTSQAEYRLHLEKLNIQARLSRIYFLLFFHRHMEAWARNNNERLQTIFEVSRSTVKAGLSPAADSLLIKATLSQIMGDLHAWRGRKEESKIALARWLNMSANHLSIKTMAFLEADPAHPLPESDQAEHFHPQLAFKREQLAYIKKQKELVSVSALPALSLLGGVQLRGNSMKTDESFYEAWEHSFNSPAHNYAVGLGLTWNLGNAFDSRLEKKRYEEELRQREAETEEVALAFRSGKEIAQQQIALTRQQIAEAEESYRSASQAYTLFEARYTSGLISITELLQIQDVLQNAAKARIESYYQFWTQHVNLAEATADFSYLQAVFE